MDEKVPDVGNAAEGKKVLVGVSGGIAAYKACEVVRLLKRAGADVVVCMTQNATRFVSPLTFSALSENKVWTGLFDADADPFPHITLSQSADVFLVVPATANIIAKIAGGIADDLVSACALATPAPVVVAPAMNAQMYMNAATQANISTLKSRGIRIIEPDAGSLACGEVGIGRLPSPESIVFQALGCIGCA